MFVVIEKTHRRVVLVEAERQKAIDYALKYSSMGGSQYIIAEVLGETKQVTSSVFSENKNVTLGPLTDEVKYVGGKPISELRSGVHQANENNGHGLVLSSGSFDRVERIPVLPGTAVESGQSGSGGSSEGHSEESPEARG